jgi:gas vesicle protein
MSDKSTEFFKGLLIGGMAGAILGILYAPKSGRETREEIVHKTEDLLSKAKEDYEKALEVSKKTYESALKRLRDRELLAKEKVERMEGEAAEIT